MKKYFIAVAIIWICTDIAYSQINLNNPNIDAIMLNQGASRVFRNSKSQQGVVQGSPYQHIMFASAKVDNVTQKYFMRYNNHLDEFEFITPKNDTLVLDKIKDFETITFVSTNKKYKLVSYTNSSNKTAYGYLVELYEKNGYSLFLKENITFYDGKKAKTSLESDMPARYAKTADTYFLKNKDLGISEFPDGKKALVKLFPEKKAEIETFVKENKIDFDEKADMIKTINFLAAL